MNNKTGNIIFYVHIREILPSDRHMFNIELNWNEMWFLTNRSKEAKFNLLTDSICIYDTNFISTRIIVRVDLNRKRKSRIFHSLLWNSISVYSITHFKRVLKGICARASVAVQANLFKDKNFLFAIIIKKFRQCSKKPSFTFKLME